MGTTTLDSFDQSVAPGAIWELAVTNATSTDMRVGWLGAVWDQVDDSTPVIIPETGTADIGDTSDVSFTVNKSGSTVRLQYTYTGVWTIAGHRRLICR